ncbi:MAG: hypothetical protein AAF529_08190 [Pseudomonadota bacterium]
MPDHLRPHLLAGYLLLLSMAAPAAGQRSDTELSFFEYLGSMVRDGDRWVDPLEADQLTDKEISLSRSGEAEQKADDAAQNAQANETENTP